MSGAVRPLPLYAVMACIWIAVHLLLRSLEVQGFETCASSCSKRLGTTDVEQRLCSTRLRAFRRLWV